MFFFSRHSYNDHEMKSKAAKWAVKNETQVAVATAIVAATIVLLACSLWKIPKSIASAGISSMLTVVCNTPHTPHRTDHMRRLCTEEGLVPYALTTELGLFVEKESAECTRIHMLFENRALSPVYAAHYMTYLSVLRYFLYRTELELLVLLEDDIVRVDASAASVHEAISKAPSFGLLFLEYCFAECDKPTWTCSGYARGYSGYCTGACAFTRSGALGLLDFAGKHRPMVIDHLTPKYSDRDDVYYTVPPMFMQSRSMFGSEVTAHASEYTACRT